MIERVATKSGEVSCKYKGRWLSSSVDPLAEAERWVQSKLAGLRAIRSAIVVGVGSGHHLRVLKSRMPHLNLVALEYNQRLIDELRRDIKNPFLGVDVVCVRNGDPLRSEHVEKALRHSNRVLEHPSSKITFEVDVEELLQRLNGRTPEAFKTLLEIRHGKLEVLPENSTPLSVHDIRDSIENSEVYDPRVTAAVMELVR